MIHQALVASRSLVLLAFVSAGITACKKAEPAGEASPVADASTAAPPTPPTPPSPPSAPRPPSAGPSAHVPVFAGAFPNDTTLGYSRAFTQGTPLSTEAKYKKGSEVLTLVISDIQSNPGARAKFASPNAKVGGHPAVTVGKLETAMLVNDRYEIKLVATSLDAEARSAFLGYCDLSIFQTK